MMLSGTIGSFLAWYIGRLPGIFGSASLGTSIVGTAVAIAIYWRMKPAMTPAKPASIQPTREVSRPPAAAAPVAQSENVRHAPGSRKRPFVRLPLLRPTIGHSRNHWLKLYRTKDGLFGGTASFCPVRARRCHQTRARCGEMCCRALVELIRHLRLGKRRRQRRRVAASSPVP